MAQKFGDIIDLDEKREAETTRATIAKGVQELFTTNEHELLSLFRAQDMGTTDKTGFVCQRVFREILAHLGISIEAAIFASPGVWCETRKITDVVDVRTGLKRKGPVKETLHWKQDRAVQDGPVEYERFVRLVVHPDGETAVAEAMAETARDANELYRLWQLICTNQRQLLQEFIMLDKYKIGYVEAGDFHKALYWALDATTSQAKLIVRNIPLQAACGSIDYRRWLVEFCKDPSIDWQAYLNVSLLASGQRELAVRETEREIRQAKLDDAVEDSNARHAEWARQQEHRRAMTALVVRPSNNAQPMF